MAQRPKITIKSADMNEDWQSEATELAVAGITKNTTERDIAEYIKKEFDKRHPPEWNCIVGRSFGSYVTHETKHFLYFYVNDMGVLLFR